VSSTRAERRLAAILAADVVGYSRLIGADEAGTLARLRVLRREVVEPLVVENGGRVFKTTGDGLLAEFPSTVQAVRCAIGVQERLRGGELQLRIGVHQGDVVVDGDDLLGDGVNVAARLEALAEPGGICVSGRVREDATGKLALDVEDIGTPPLKNIAQPVHVFRVHIGTPERPTLALPDKPSLAVLPFKNMSGDPEQEYFADGMVEDITTALSRIGGLFVIARNSSFTYKGRAVDVKQVGRELGVRYVLEGSVRKAGGRVRIACQLVNALTGAHIWADRFDSTLDDIFDLQDRVTESVAGAIEPTLRNAEIERAANKPTESLDAYDLYLRALYHHDQFTRTDFEEALGLLQRAVALDPRFALAKALAASCVMQMVELGAYSMGGLEKPEAVDLARSALAAARDDPTTLSYAGYAIASMGLDIEAGRMALDRAILLNPNSAHALWVSGWLHNFTGDSSAARDEFVRAMRLSPLDPDLRFLLLGLGIAMTELGEAEQAVSIIRRSIAAGMGRVWFAWSHLINCLVLLGRMDEAREAARALLELDPGRTLTLARAQMAEWNNPHCERRMASLRAAGIPE
jgi:adenylate cyclase